MNKKNLFFATFCMILLTSEVYSQRTPVRGKFPVKKEVPKKEEPKKQVEQIIPLQVEQPVFTLPQEQKKELSPAEQRAKNMQLPNSKVTDKAPTLNVKNINLFNKHMYAKDKWSAEFKVIGRDFTAGDNSTTKTVPAPNMGKFCTTTTLNTNLNTTDFKDFTVTGPPDWLKPGIIMDAVEFVQGKDKIEERYNRGPVTISNTATGGLEVIDNPKNKSAINRAIFNIQSKDPKQVHGANISYSYTEIQSEDELNFKVNGRYSSTFGAISAELGVKGNYSKSHHYYLVEFQQSLYSLEVDALDKENIFPNNPDVDLSSYVYISKVNYGRKGYFMLITDKSLEDFGVKASASMNYKIHSAAIQSNLEKISKSNSTKVKAFYYGGSVQSVVKDIGAKWDETGRKPLHDYIAGYQFSQAEAYPISYEMKNLDNQRVGMTSKNVQTIPTCVDSNGMKLKVTLLQLQSATTQDSDNIADLGIVQHVRYKSNGKFIKPIKRNLNKFAKEDKCELGGGGVSDDDATALVCGDRSRQIQVTVSKKIDGTRTANIDNSAIFDITHQEANDTDAEFLIDTYVKEYSNPDIVLNEDPRKTKVAIHDVLAILNGIKTINENKNFFDGSVSKSMSFDNFDGISLPLRNVGTDGKIILEGPIRARNRGSDSKEKAFVWMRFELIK